MRTSILAVNRWRTQAWRAALPFAFWGTVLFAAVAAEKPPSAKALRNQPWPPSTADRVVRIGSVYPHLAVYNSSGECGIGAIAAWAGKLWFITYPPHFPEGSDDKLYALDQEMRLAMRAESVGGTHANRMIHDASQQLIIGPYFIDTHGIVRAANLKQLRARLTATTRHFSEDMKVFFLGMERELFEVDVSTLATKKIYGEMEGPFPGYHGKGARVAANRLIVANNGEKNWDIARDPHFNGPAGALAETDGSDWRRPFDVIARTNFTEVTGPGGIHSNFDDNRVWALGWDKRSVLLAVREANVWHRFRLPKGSYTHDALHGWFTEWPRIREVGNNKWLMHMHGLFYDFPPTFSVNDTSGLRPISTYLKMPVDYCAWRDGIAMACDDTSIMQNPLAGQSHSNLRFLQWSDLARYGAPSGWGGVWLEDSVAANQTSDPFLVSGFARGTLHIRHAAEKAVAFRIEIDPTGRGDWKNIGTMQTGGDGYVWRIINDDLPAVWMRLTPDHAVEKVTAYFHLSNASASPDPSKFAGLPSIADPQTPTLLIKPAQGDARELLAATSPTPERAATLFTIDGRLVFQKSDDTARASTMIETFAPTKPAYSEDDASIIVTDGAARFRLPHNRAFSARPEVVRNLREVVTERHLFNAHGTFYEVPRAASGGWRRMRPVTTHNKWIADFCSWRGLLVLAAAVAKARDDPRIFASANAQDDCALWLGEVDELWSMGAPRGSGGPWHHTRITANTPSDPYLMTGYDAKSLRISHDADRTVVFRIEVDFLADQTWSEYARFTVAPHAEFTHDFPSGYSAHWVRLIADTDVAATATFIYTAP